jgi:hypothetical protein
MKSRQPELNRECRELLKSSLKPAIEYREVDGHINENSFAEATLEALLRLVD